MKSMKQLFEYLGAPLVNYRKSWGAVRDDGTVFLRCWQEETRLADGRLYVGVHANDITPSNFFGYNERAGHVNQIMAGAPAYVILLSGGVPFGESWDGNTRKSKLLSDRHVWKAGEVVHLHGIEDLFWLELVCRVPVEEVLQARHRG